MTNKNRDLTNMLTNMYTQDDYDQVREKYNLDFSNKIDPNTPYQIMLKKKRALREEEELAAQKETRRLNREAQDDCNKNLHSYYCTYPHFIDKSDQDEDESESEQYNWEGWDR